MTKKEAATKESPLPWMVNEDRNIVSSEDVCAEGCHKKRVAQCDRRIDTTLIVRRVNQGPAFDAMVDALREVINELKWLDKKDTDAYRQSIAALKLAQESK